jgi:ion channel-forming bestrophin family protein
LVTPIDDYSYIKRSPSSISDLEKSSRKDFRWSTSPKKGRFKKDSIEKKKVRQTVVASRSFKEKFLIYSGEHLHWLQVIFRLVETVVPGILPWVSLSGGYALIIALLSHVEILSFLEEKSRVIQIFVLSLNIVLSLLLAFRTNTAHERFWEGRKLWGAMVNTVRNLARGIWLVIEEKEPKDRKEKESALRLVVAFAVAMKLHLRREHVNSKTTSGESSSFRDCFLDWRLSTTPIRTQTSKRLSANSPT